MSTHVVPSNADVQKIRKQLLRDPQKFYGSTRGWFERLIDRILVAIS